jgi:hypothetical protein
MQNGLALDRRGETMPELGMQIVRSGYPYVKDKRETVGRDV